MQNKVWVVNYYKWHLQFIFIIQPSRYAYDTTISVPLPSTQLLIGFYQFVSQTADARLSTALAPNALRERKTPI
jgi:hypothetical protein